LLFEAVPNISEGRDAAVVDACVTAVEAQGARVLHRTSDAAHNRSVLTIAGRRAAVLAASVELSGIAAERIDLRAHSGIHPRIGALDVLPFVPLHGATIAEAVELAHETGHAIWDRYGIPCFFYGEAATTPARRLLADVRQGQFEGLDARFELPHWRPDVGNTARHPSAGAIAIGARQILIAFNVELATGDVRIARRIARIMRERHGGLRTLRALGLRLSHNIVQVSLNVTDFHATPLYRIVEAIRRLAAVNGVAVRRCELIGCLPYDAVASAARFYLGCRKESR
jgi:glutamate formiminotransferase